MIIFSILVAALVFSFAGVLFFGAPYLPTLSPQVTASLSLVKLKPGSALLELGCGDGKVVLAAARTGLKVVGYELNPLLALVAWLRTRKYRKNVQIVWGDFWKEQWPEADAIFVFLLPKYMKKLDTKIVQYPHKPVKLVSFAFQIENRSVSKELNGVYLYSYR